MSSCDSRGRATRPWRAIARTTGESRNASLENSRAAPHTGASAWGALRSSRAARGTETRAVSALQRFCAPYLTVVSTHRCLRAWRPGPRPRGLAASRRRGAQ
eukprot:5598342-Prymnesium_polylepis.1